VKLRQNPALDNTRIIMVSGKMYEFDELRARELGANGYIKKPFTPEKVQEVVGPFLP